MASKDWTQEQRERAFSQIDEILNREEIVSHNGHGYDAGIIDLQCEINEARELLEAYSEVGITIRDEQVMEWLSRNK